jgi:ribosomal protein S18 acetylase RimI-like enzyme
MNLLPDIPNGLRLAVDTDPSTDFRAELGRLINQFHGETVPFHASRFTLRLEDQDSRLVGGLSGVMSWGWLFIDALWVHADCRGQGIGRVLMAHAESRAAAAGCHSAWLDTFQARGFYQAIGYSVFGTLGDYPASQTRSFLKKRLPDKVGDPDQTAPRA